MERPSNQSDELLKSKVVPDFSHAGRSLTMPDR